MLDESGSIGESNFNRTKSFLSNLTGHLDIDSGNTHVGLITFSDRVTERFSLTTHSTVDSVQNAILSLSYSKGKTDTAAALSYVETKMLTSAAGDRPDVPNVIILLTDGESHDETATLVSNQLYISI